MMPGCVLRIMSIEHEASRRIVVVLPALFKPKEGIFKKNYIHYAIFSHIVILRKKRFVETHSLSG